MTVNEEKQQIAKYNDAARTLYHWGGTLAQVGLYSPNLDDKEIMKSVHELIRGFHGMRSDLVIQRLAIYLAMKTTPVTNPSTLALLSERTELIEQVIKLKKSAVCSWRAQGLVRVQAARSDELRKLQKGIIKELMYLSTHCKVLGVLLDEGSSKLHPWRSRGCTEIEAARAERQSASAWRKAAYWWQEKYFGVAKGSKRKADKLTMKMVRNAC
jgi:hypothetical protein